MTEHIEPSQRASVAGLVEALERIEKRCAEYERINVVGKTKAAVKSGTIRNCLFDARAALQNAGRQAK